MTGRNADRPLDGWAQFAAEELGRSNWTMLLAVLGAVIVSLSNGLISWDALTAVGQAAHVRPGLAAAYPSGVDGLLFVAIITAYALRRAPIRKRVYVWILIGYATAVSLGSNALHSTAEHGVVVLPWAPLGPAIASTVPSVSWAATVHLLVVMRRALEEMQERVAVAPRARRARPGRQVLKRAWAWRYAVALAVLAVASTVLSLWLWRAPWSLLLLAQAALSAGCALVLARRAWSAQAEVTIDSKPEPPDEPSDERALPPPNPPRSPTPNTKRGLARALLVARSWDETTRAQVIQDVARLTGADVTSVRRVIKEIESDRAS